MTLSLVVFFLTNNVSIIAITKSVYSKQVESLREEQLTNNDKEIITDYLWRTINFGVSENTKVGENISNFFSSKEILHLKMFRRFLKLLG